MFLLAEYRKPTLIPFVQPVSGVSRSLGPGLAIHIPFDFRHHCSVNRRTHGEAALARCSQVQRNNLLHHRGNSLYNSSAAVIEAFRAGPTSCCPPACRSHALQGTVFKESNKAHVQATLDHPTHNPSAILMLQYWHDQFLKISIGQQTRDTSTPSWSRGRQTRTTTTESRDVGKLFLGSPQRTRSQRMQGPPPSGRPLIGPIIELRIRGFVLTRRVSPAASHFAQGDNDNGWLRRRGCVYFYPSGMQWRLAA